MALKNSKRLNTVYSWLGVPNLASDIMTADGFSAKYLIQYHFNATVLNYRKYSSRYAL
jgi:hypothetical protein